MKISFSVILFLIQQIVFAQTPYVTLKGKQFYLNGAPFFPMVMNYSADLVHDNNNNFNVIRDRKYGTQEYHLEPTSRYSNINNCDLSLSDDFRKLKSMGFNTIRLLLSANRKDNNTLGFTIKARRFNPPSTIQDTDLITLDLSPPYTNSNTQIFLNAIKHVLVVANQEDMKVILLCANHSGVYTGSDGNPVYYQEMSSAITDANDYALFLSKMANVLKNEPALLAYDLYNEPGWGVYERTDNSSSPTNYRSVKEKSSVCQFVALWYDAIKTNDQNHLITLGLWDMGDVVSWDPDVMKIDFISMHLYSYPNSLDPNNLKVIRQTERVVNLIKWCSNAIQKPWLLGETVFSASSDVCLDPYLWGSEADQNYYLTNVLNAVRDCGGSGFSWWQFQDLHWFCVPDEICPNGCSYCDTWGGVCGDSLFSIGSTTYALPSSTKMAEAIALIPGNYGGLLSYSDPDSISGNYNPNFDRIAVSYTNNFNPFNYQSCSPSTYYYDPYHFSTGNFSSGTVRDLSGKPIKDAVVTGKSIINYSSTNSKSVFVYTFTKADGTFTLYAPSDPNTSFLNSIIVEITISAAGGESVTSIPGQNLNINIKKHNFDYNGTDGYTPQTTIAHSLKGWQTMTVTDINVNSGTTSEIKARGEVHLLSNFHASNGSNVHMYCAPTFPDCNNYNNYRENTTIDGPLSEKRLPKDKGTLIYTKQYQNGKSIEKEECTVQPNPNNGKFQIVFDSKNQSLIKSIILFNFSGTQVLNQTNNNNEVDISNLPNGIYFVKIITIDEQIITKKIIKE